jgi:hypothetical protein
MESKATNSDPKEVKYRTFDEYRERFYKRAATDKSEQEEKDGSASFGRDLARELVNRK